MNPISHLIFALADLPDLPGAASQLGVPSRRAFGDVGLILAVGLGVALIFIIWAKFFRKAKADEPKHHWLAENEEPEDESEEGHRRRKKRKRLRRDHRPRNPTLAETGGLPPQRSHDSPEQPK